MHPVPGTRAGARVPPPAPCAISCGLPRCGPGAPPDLCAVRCGPHPLPQPRPHHDTPLQPRPFALPAAGDLYGLLQKRRGMPLSEDTLMDWFVQVRWAGGWLLWMGGGGRWRRASAGHVLANAWVRVGVGGRRAGGRVQWPRAEGGRGLCRQAALARAGPAMRGGGRGDNRVVCSCVHAVPALLPEVILVCRMSFGRWLARAEVNVAWYRMHKHMLLPR